MKVAGGQRKRTHRISGPTGRAPPGRGVFVDAHRWVRLSRGSRLPTGYLH